MSLAGLRWGILGTARINRSVIPAIRAVERQTVVAIASRTPARARDSAEAWEIPRACDYDGLLAAPDIDAIYVPLPNRLHAEWTIHAADAGKHVLCEKPLALTVPDVDAISMAARRNGVHVAEAFMYCHHPQSIAIAQWLRDGVIGDLRLVRSCFSFTLERPGDVRFDPSMGGGSLWDIGCYPVSLARLLAGGSPIEVTGLSVLGQTGIDVTFSGVLRFPRDMLATFDASFVAPFRTEAEIVGAGGTLRVAHPFKPGQREVVLLTRGDSVIEREVEAQPLYTYEIEDFARVVATGERARVTLDDSRATVATMVALHQSAREKRSIAASLPSGDVS
jgi:xylose dehydrogenase (NAD/NADP)